MAEDTAAPEAPETGAEGGAEQEAAPDFGRLMESFESFRNDVTERLDGLEQPVHPEDLPDFEEEAPQQQQQAPPGQFAPEDFDPETQQLTAEAAQRELDRMIDARAQEVAARTVAPLQQERMLERMTQQADALEERYPELQDEEVSKEMIELSIEAAQKLGQPALGTDPQFLEQVYLAEKARERAAQESPDGADDEVHLEGGSGGNAAEEPPEDAGDRIVALAQKGSVFGR